MSRQLLDYDPINKVSCFYDFNPADGKVTLSHEQDVSAILTKNMESRNDDDKTKRGIKNDWWKYATVPAVVEIEWMTKYGVRMSDPGHKKKVFQLLNSREYSYLKTTSKVHTVSNAE
jgi:hypothetical protein